MAACKAANAQAPAITVSRSVLLLANEQDHAIHIGSRSMCNMSGQVSTGFVNDEPGGAGA